MPKQTLLNISSEKRERLLREAALLFSERGYEQTDMAALAERCGISKGSIYTYFASKDELYLYVCRDGLTRSRSAVWGAVDPSWDIFLVVEHTFRAGVAFAREHPELVKLYLSVASVGLEKMARELSTEVERPTAERLKELIRVGIKAGTVRSDVDASLAAWHINNTYVMLLASLVSEHFKIRLRAYLELTGKLTQQSTSVLCDRVVQMIHESLQRPTAKQL